MIFNLGASGYATVETQKKHFISGVEQRLKITEKASR